jgi:8-oxo-dGTP diphosphatase
MTNITKLGVGVLLVNREDQVLLGKRKGSHGEGQWALPGGHLEFGESFEDCARRELEEELGTDIEYNGLHVVSVINLMEYYPKHYIDIGMMAFYDGGEPEVMEPDKVETWEWFWMYNLPTPLLAVLLMLLAEELDSTMLADIGITLLFVLLGACFTNGYGLGDLWHNRGEWYTVTADQIPIVMQKLFDLHAFEDSDGLLVERIKVRVSAESYEGEMCYQVKVPTILFKYLKIRMTETEKLKALGLVPQD